MGVADTKQDVLDMLRELAELTMLDEGDPQSFRVRAYESAAQAIAAQATDLGKLTVEGAAEDRGHRQEHRREDPRAARDRQGREARGAARRSTRPAWSRCCASRASGPKALKRLRAELGVAVDRRPARARWPSTSCATLKGFGAEVGGEARRRRWRGSTQQGAVGRTPISVALPLATRIVARLREVPGVTHASYCGSLRRFSETIGDVDIVVAAERRRAGDGGAGGDERRSIACSGAATSKTSVVTRRGTQVDLRVVAPRTSSARRCSTSPGSKGHNIKLRQRALARGWTLNEYALSEIEGGKVVASETEEQIYAALGLPFIPPVLREDAGEIEAAESGHAAAADRRR